MRATDLQAAASGLAQTRRRLDAVSAAHREAGRSGERSIARLASAWRSPASTTFQGQAREQLAALDRAVTPLERADGALRHLAERAEALASQLAVHERTRDEAISQLRIARATLVALPPEDTAGRALWRQREQTALGRRNAAERGMVDVGVSWDQTCRSVAQTVGHAATELGTISTHPHAAVLDPVVGSASGAGLARDLRGLLHLDVAADFDEIAAVLARLGDASDAQLRALFSGAGLAPADLMALLVLIHDAHERADPVGARQDLVDAEPTAALLQPLAEAFARAAAIGAISEGFIYGLVRGGPAIGDPNEPGWRVPPSTTELVAQLLLFDGVLDSGSPHVTAALAELVLADDFLARTRTIGAAHSPWRLGPIDRPDTWFDSQLVLVTALGALARSPEASHLFMRDADNQVALLNRAEDGWGQVVGEPHQVGQIISNGLLVWPASQGHFDGDRPLPSATHDAVVSLLTEVARRDGVHAGISGALATVLLPHLSTVGFQAARDRAWRAAETPSLDPNRVDVDLLHRYLARVVRHEDGMNAMVDVTSTWTTALLLRHAEDLTAGGAYGATTADLRASSYELAGVHHLVGDALDQAGHDRAQQMWFFSALYGEASSQARRQAIRAVGLSGGVKGYLASEALSLADRQVAPRIEEALFPPTMATRDYDALLGDLIPNLTAITLTTYAEERARHDADVDLQTLVPVMPDLREIETVTTTWRPGWLGGGDRIHREEVGIEQWTQTQLSDWVGDNRAALGLDRHVRGDGEDWWLAEPLELFSSQYRGDYGR